MAEEEGLDVLIRQAISGSMGLDAQAIAEIGVKWIETILKKNSNYGGSVWKEPVLSPRSRPGEAIFIRMSDKVERIRSLRLGKEDLVGESLEDTVADLGSYCLLWLARPGDCRESAGAATVNSVRAARVPYPFGGEE